VQDLRFREGLVLAPLAVLIILLGVYPHPVAASPPRRCRLREAADTSQQPVVMPTSAHIATLTEVER